MAGTLDYALKLSTSAFTGPMSAATGALRGLGSAAGSAGGMVAGLTAKLAAVAVPLGVAGLAFKSFTKAADFESMKVGFTTVLGSAAAANAMLKEIAATAASTPYGINELAQSARSLLAVTDREKITPTLRMIGDLASAAQRPITELASMYAKIKGSDSVQGEDLNQLSDALPGSLQEFVKVLKVDSVAAVRKLGAEGRITGAALDQVFINLSSKGGIAFNAMDAQSKTTIGLISTLKDAFDQLLIAIGTPINDLLKPYIEANTSRLENLTVKFKAFLALLQGASSGGNLGEFLGASLKLALIDGVNTFAGGITGSVAYLGAALPRVAQSFAKNLLAADALLAIEKFFTGIGELLASQLLSALSNIPGLSGLQEDASREASSGKNRLRSARNLIEDADFSGGFAQMLADAKAANEAGVKSFREATAKPLLNRDPALADFQRTGAKADAAALKLFLNPEIKETVKEVVKLKSAFTGLTPLIEKVKAQTENAPSPSEGASPSLNEAAEKFRGVRDPFQSYWRRREARSDADKKKDPRADNNNTDLLALDNFKRRTARQPRFINPDRAAEQLDRSNAAADPGRPRREERAEAKLTPDQSLLKAVKDIAETFTNLAKA